MFRRCPEVRIDRAVVVCSLTVGALLAAPATVPAQSRAGAVAPTLSVLRNLPGRTSLLVLQNGRQIAARNADLPLAVGSSFKMALLLTLKKQVQAGRYRWTDVVRMKSHWKVPGGVLYDWPDGTPVTLETLGGFMISHSDNTATDAVMDVVGREHAERYTGRNRPLLSTHDLFFFKDLRHREWLERYRRAGVAERRAILAQVAKMPLDLANAAGPSGPYALDLEWHFTNRELCGIVAQIADLDIMGIQTFSANRADWARVAFKGGSEPGVVSTTFWLTARDGRTYCVSASWNNDRATVDNDYWKDLMAGLLSRLRGR
jgi:beta-lactamase class A